ncbi:MAG TPA: hypothetical protein PKW95_10010 [bacterium]|nr:hypothetical protein [bacterium]
MSSNEHPTNTPPPPETSGGFERAHPNVGFLLFGFLCLGAVNLAIKGALLSALLTFAAGLLFYPPVVRRVEMFIANWKVHFGLRAAGLLLLLALSVAARPTSTREVAPVSVTPEKALQQALAPDMPEPEAAPTPIPDEPTAATPTPPPEDLPIYTTLARNVTDTAARGEIALDVLVISNLKRDSLERLLRHLEQQTAPPGALKHRPQPDRLTIAAFTSEEHWRSETKQWIALLERDGAQPARVRFNENAIKALAYRPTYRFGLTEETRRAIYHQIVAAENEAERLTEKQFPTDPTQELKPGEQFMITRPTPIRYRKPWKNDAAPPDILHQTYLNAGAVVTIKARTSLNDTVWYEVGAKEKSLRRQGWIRAADLTGQGGTSNIRTHLERQAQMYREQQTRLLFALAREHNLTREQLEEIGLEGLIRDWPIPPKEK